MPCPSSMLYLLQIRSESTDSSSSSEMSQISTSTITETRAHIPIFSVRKRKRSLMEEQGRRLSEPRSTKFSRVSAYVASFEVEGSIGPYLRCSENIKDIEELDLRRSATSKIASFVNAGLLSGEQASVAVEHFGAAAHGLFGVEMWLGLKDDKKVNYIKSLRRQDTQQMKLTTRRQGCSSI
ncbi:uncharacterized protein LOC130739997 [Lotus japonicus]|uniref:uncharacterized protein LOC130739997 n=1 Tax=Lotus japonicus TaxID=34305 RepID=UPI002582B932|nr:uncharacterized protein LOC130739997 [Lotus japonicus]